MQEHLPEKLEDSPIGLVIWIMSGLGVALLLVIFW